MRALASGLLLVLTGLLLWWMVAGSSEVAPSLPASAREVGSEPGARRSGGTEARDADRVQVDGAATDMAGAADQTAARTLTVRVVHPDGRPAVGAQVAWCAQSDAWRESKNDAAWQDWARDPFAVLLQEGSAVTTNAEGLASLPSTEPADERTASVTCEVHALLESPDGTWHAVARRTWRRLLDETLELRLVADRSLAFRVVGPDGEGIAGVPLEVKEPWLPLGATDDQGLLRTAHVQSWFFDWDPEYQPVGAVEVIPDLPGLTTFAVSVDPALAEAEPEHTIHLPATGSLVAELPWLEHRAGTKQRLRVRLQEPEPARRGGGRTDWSAEVEDGRAAFPLVALDRQWHIPASWPVEVAQSVDGPRRPDQQVVVVLEQRRRPRITGRLLSADGPVADASVQMRGRLPESTETEWFAAGRSGDDGQFVLELSRSEAGSSWQALRLHALLDADSNAPRVFGADLPGSYRMSDEAVDLGDVLVTEHAPLWRGRIVDAKTGESIESRPWVLACQRAGRDYERWQEANVLLSKDGHVTVFDTAPPAQLFLSVIAKGYLPDPPHLLLPGTRDGLLELHHGGRARVVLRATDRRLSIGMRARLVPDDGRDADSLLVGTPWTRPGEAQLFAELDRSVPDHPVWLEDDARPSWLLQWSGVPPGRYRLQVGGHGTGAVIDRAGVEIVDGEESDLGSIDLDDQVEFTILNLTMPEGFEPPGHDESRLGHGLGHLYFGSPAMVAADRMQIDGLLVWFVNSKPQDVVLEIPGCRRKVLLATTGEVDVAMEPGIPVRFELGDSTIAPEHLRIALQAGAGVELYRGGATWSPAAGGATASSREGTVCYAAFEEDGPIARVTAAGTWNLRVEVRDGAGPWSEVARAARTVQVPEEGRTLPLDLPR